MQMTIAAESLMFCITSKKKSSYERKQVTMMNGHSKSAMKPFLNMMRLNTMSIVATKTITKKAISRHLLC